jgi:hypothetical protein
MTTKKHSEERLHCAITIRFLLFGIRRGEEQAFVCHRHAWIMPLVARLGFEPRQTDSKSVVLPLHNPAVYNRTIIIAWSAYGMQPQINFAYKEPSSLRSLYTANAINRSSAVAHGRAYNTGMP